MSNTRHFKFTSPGHTVHREALEHRKVSKASAQMVQLEPNLALQLKHLAAHGAVVSAEQQVFNYGFISFNMLT